jgi:prepilin-type processing-associated H-X9-DG protein
MGQPENSAILSRCYTSEFECPSAHRGHPLAANYVAIIGPGTIWRKDGTVSVKDISNRSVTVMAIECADSERHWAEPYVLTDEEVLDRLKKGQGNSISTAHPSVVNVLFADGSVYGVRADLPLSHWRKLLAGQYNNIDELESGIEEDPSDPVPEKIAISPPSEPENAWPYLFAIPVWLISVTLLFYRAWHSRPARKTAGASGTTESAAG